MIFHRGLLSRLILQFPFPSSIWIKDATFLLKPQVLNRHIQNNSGKRSTAYQCLEKFHFKIKASKNTMVAGHAGQWFMGVLVQKGNFSEFHLLCNLEIGPPEEACEVSSLNRPKKQKKPQQALLPNGSESGRKPKL